MEIAKVARSQLLGLLSDLTRLDSVWIFPRCSANLLLGRLSMERRLSAVLAFDMVGYSRLMGVDERGTLGG